MIDSLRYWVEEIGVSGFRFDLATVLGREPGFNPDAQMLQRIKADPVLSKSILVAEPWDPGPGGYQLGRFGKEFHEHNDTYRDDVRSFWKGDQGKIGALAGKVAGSAEIFNFAGRKPSAGVNMLAVHDGYTLADLVSYLDKHNEANGENNRDGHNNNHSWNCGAEGPTDDPNILAARQRDIRALLATLFLSRGLPLLQQGDEFGPHQQGNNNAYAQDNEITWLDWEHADGESGRFRFGAQRFPPQPHGADARSLPLRADQERGSRCRLAAPGRSRDERRRLERCRRLGAGHAAADDRRGPDRVVQPPHRSGAGAPARGLLDRGVAVGRQGGTPARRRRRDAAAALGGGAGEEPRSRRNSRRRRRGSIRRKHRFSPRRRSRHRRLDSVPGNPPVEVPPSAPPETTPKE